MYQGTKELKVLPFLFFGRTQLYVYVVMDFKINLNSIQNPFITAQFEKG
jgi:hypothetical protein